MSVKGLVEGVILQAMEDLWNEGYREDSVSFFKGRDFSLCADIAGLNLDDQVRMLKMVKDVVDHQGKRQHAGRPAARTRGTRQRAHGKVAVASCR